MQLFDEVRDGLILCKLINDSVPDTIDTRVLNIPIANKPLNNFKITENNNIVITSAKAIGCSVVNIGSSDIAEGREHLILGLIWQIIRRGLLAQVDIKLHPELYRLCEEGETLDDLLRLTPDQILLRWFNYHLKAAGHKRRCAFLVSTRADLYAHCTWQRQQFQPRCQRRRKLHRSFTPA
jgi:plastin-1